MADGVKARTLTSGKVVWDVTWRAKDESGKSKVHQKRGFPTEDKAKRFRRTTITAVETKTWVKPTRETLGEYLDDWLKRARVKTQTLCRYENLVKHQITPRVGHLPLDQVSPLHLDRLYVELEREGRVDGRPLAKATVRHVHNLLSGAFRDAVRVGVLPGNPCHRASPPRPKDAKREARVPDTWSGEQRASFLRSCEADDLFPLWHFIAHTGVRRGEGLGLRWTDCDLDGGYCALRQTVGQSRVGDHRSVYFDTPKGDAPRVIALDSVTIRVLRRHQAQQQRDRLALGENWKDLGLVFPRHRRSPRLARFAGRPLEPENVSRSFRAAVSRWGGKPITLHGLRHTWATLALEAGIDIRVVQERLGHASPVITQSIYQHVTRRMDKEAAERVASL